MKRLKNAKQIPLVTPEGKKLDRNKVFWRAGKNEPKKPKVYQPLPPYCKCGRFKGPKARFRVELDAFGRPTDKCQQCRAEAIGVQGSI